MAWRNALRTSPRAPVPSSASTTTSPLTCHSFASAIGPQAALGEILCEQGVAFELVETPDLHELHVQPGIARQPGDHVAVASVVAGAADDGEPPRIWPAFAQRPEGGAAGAVHQANARNAEIVDCPAVEGANVRPCVDSRDHPC